MTIGDINMARFWMFVSKKHLTKLFNVTKFDGAIFCEQNIEYKLCDITSLFGVFLETNEHQNLEP